MWNDFKKLSERADKTVVVVKEAALIWDQALDEQDNLSKRIKDHYDDMMAPLTKRHKENDQNTTALMPTKRMTAQEK